MSSIIPPLNPIALRKPTGPLQPLPRVRAASALEHVKKSSKSRAAANCRRGTELKEDSGLHKPLRVDLSGSNSAPTFSVLVDGFRSECAVWRTLCRTSAHRDYQNKWVRATPDLPSQIHERDRDLMKRRERDAPTPADDDKLPVARVAEASAPLPRSIATIDYSNRRHLVDAFHSPVFPAQRNQIGAKFPKPKPWGAETPLPMG